MQNESAQNSAVNLASLTVDTDAFSTTATFLANDLPSPQDDAAADTLQVTFMGEGDLTLATILENLMTDLHEAALKSAVDEVILDVRGVSFMNASCFTKLIAWVTKVRKMATEDRYRIRIKSDEGKLWQRRSMHALQCFAIELVTIDTSLFHPNVS